MGSTKLTLIGYIVAHKDILLASQVDRHSKREMPKNLRNQNVRVAIKDFDWYPLHVTGFTIYHSRQQNAHQNPGTNICIPSVIGNAT